MHTDRANTFLVIGESGVGKTHYGAQVLIRFNEHTGVLRMVDAADLEPYEMAIACLNEGKAAPHTGSVYLESRWMVEDQYHSRIELIWPDYNGEHIRDMPSTRQIALPWRQRVVDSHGWMFVIRVQHTNQREDI